MSSFEMIEINLLPEELKQKGEKLGINISSQLLCYILSATLGLIVFIHLYLGGLFLIKTVEHKSLNKKWAQLDSERQAVDEWKRQHRISSQQTGQMNELLAKRITIWDKMQVLSQALPNGVWFEQINLKQGGFKLRGSVVSLKKNHMRLLNLFLSRLKENRQFFKDFSRLELGSMSMRTRGGFSIMDFILEGDLK
jgi:Tfp pilus assembly protein PilN